MPDDATTFKRQRDTALLERDAAIEAAESANANAEQLAAKVDEFQKALLLSLRALNVLRRQFADSVEKIDVVLSLIEQGKFDDNVDGDRTAEPSGDDQSKD